MAINIDELTREFLEVVPLLMRQLRGEFRSHRTPDLSVPQFRALVFVNRNPGTALSPLAEHLGLTLPSTSKMVDQLVVRSYLDRQSSRNDRRKITLEITSLGNSVLDKSYQATQEQLQGLFEELNTQEQEEILSSLQILRTLFARHADKVFSKAIDSQ
jgi:DNA-binding MarR family transcriptional regulator